MVLCSIKEKTKSSLLTSVKLVVFFCCSCNSFFARATVSLSKYSFLLRPKEHRLLILFFVYPFYEMLKGSLIGLLSYLLIVLSRMVAAKLSRGNLLASFLHPISILLFIYLLITSWIQHSRGNLSWKGRKL